MGSEATKKAIPGNMHIDARVIEVACIKSKVKSYPPMPLRLRGGCHSLRGRLNYWFGPINTDPSVIEVV